MKNLPSYKRASFFIGTLRDRIHLEVMLNNSESVSLAVEIFLNGIKEN